MKTSGVYAIVHRESGRQYVGQAQDIIQRWRQHQYLLRDGRHHSRYLQCAWGKYGPDAFDFEVLILAPVRMLDDLEQAYLDDPETSHLNIARDASTTRGLRHTAESKAKMSAALKGKSAYNRGKPGPRPSLETRAKMSASKKGRKVSPETKAKMSEAAKGRKYSPEARAKMSAGQKGRKHSPESRARISEANRGRTMPLEAIEKIRAANTGRKHSPESRAKMSAAKQGRKAKNSCEPKKEARG